MLEYKNGEIGWNWETYNCSDDTDMKILCDKINALIIDLDYDITQMKNKLNSIDRIIGGK